MICFSVFNILQVVNWSYILKYLLSTISGLRQTQHREAAFHARPPISEITSTTPLTPVERVQQRRKSVLRDSDPRRQSNLAGKLGPRLQNPTKQVAHNNAVFQEVDQIGPPDDDVSALGSESGSYRSATSTQKHPSTFAKSVVQQLGVNKQEEDAAMAVIDRVSKITVAQLSRMDAATRDQILHIRDELGLGSVLPVQKPVKRNNNQETSQAYTTPTYRSSGANIRRNVNSGQLASRQVMNHDDDDTYSQLDEMWH